MLRGFNRIETNFGRKVYIFYQITAIADQFGIQITYYTQCFII